jgi:hypothetical protein
MYQASVIPGIFKKRSENIAKITANAYTQLVD